MRLPPLSFPIRRVVVAIAVALAGVGVATALAIDDEWAEFAERWVGEANAGR